MTIQYPDYTHGITNLSCSVLKYFGAETKHSTLPEADSILESKKPRNVVVLLCDAMGISIIERHLPESSFIRTHIVTPISSTFPPTTVAATTSVNTGLTPLETGWLGWITYFKEIDQNVVTFFNTRQMSPNEQAAPYSLAWKLIPYKPLSQQITEASPDVTCHSIAPFQTDYKGSISYRSLSFGHHCRLIRKLSEKTGRNFIYAYWPDPDHTMHEIGIDKPRIKRIMKRIDNRLNRLSRKLHSDTQVFVIADHGQVNSKWFYLYDYPELRNLLIREHSIENRAASLFVKEGKKEEFRKKFKEYFGEHFILLSHDEILEKCLFGTGAPHPLTDSFIGDFVAISKDEYCLGEMHDKKPLIGMHAGMSPEEMNVPLISL